MKRYVLIPLLLQFVLMQLSGCSFAPYATVNISKNPALTHLDDFQSIKDVKRIFSNVEIEESVSDTNTVIWKASNLKSGIGNIEIGPNKTFTIKYHRCLLHQAPNVRIPVKFPNGLKYSAYLDTGFNGYVALTSDIVLDNKLAILPVGPNLQSNASGICYIPALNIGPAQIKDTLGFYTEQQWQFRIMNVLIYKQTDIILGREFIKSFDYVLFDNVNQEVVFSKDGAFEPDNPQLWTSYTFLEDPNRGNTIMVKMPIAGQVFEVAFDSCGEKPGLELNKSQWNTIKPNLSVKRLRKSHYYSYQAGRMSCQEATVSEISVGEKIIKNADVDIIDDPESLSIISLGYFQQTSVILDYVNNLMWIKK